MRPLDLWRQQLSQPFREDLFTNWDRLMEEWSTPRLIKDGRGQMMMSPKCDVSESKNYYMLNFDLPGVSKDQVKIDLHDNQITVSGERREERKEEDKDKKSYLSEVYYGSFMRSFSFPTTVDVERAEAKFENGVLTIQVPKENGARARQITIK